MWPRAASLCSCALATAMPTPPLPAVSAGVAGVGALATTEGLMLLWAWLGCGAAELVVPEGPADKP